VGGLLEIPGGPPYPGPVTVLFNSAIFAVLLIPVQAAVRRARGKRGVFREEIRITELREGMIPAEAICERDGRVERIGGGLLRLRMPDCDRILADPRRAAGVSRYQVGVLRRLVREGRLEDRIRIKLGMPYAPALGIGAIVAVLYGDLYWRALTALAGA